MSSSLKLILSAYSFYNLFTFTPVTTISLILFLLILISELVSLLGGASVGIHSMVDEHFGISVVEYMAAGAIPIGS